MDDLPGNASIAARVEPTPHGSRFHFFASCMLISIILGLIGACILIWFPYNRVVVFYQPTSTVIRLSSVHLKEGGFVVIYLDEPPGTLVVGHSAYLPRGYYRNLVLPFEFEPVLPTINFGPDSQVKRSYQMLIRLYQDTGDQVFDASNDRVVRDVFGNPYTRQFRMEYQRHDAPKGIFLLFPKQPFEYVADRLFP